ncbi:MAG: peptide chain release factor 1 [Candidatus Kaelpia aquatica]|nr:peptide chain release factor 1 [Candidatus Kaelpia aquatica]
MKEEYRSALDQIRQKYDEIVSKLSQIEIASDYGICQEYAKERARYENVVAAAKLLEEKELELKGITEMLDQSGVAQDMKELAGEERERLSAEIDGINVKIERLILDTFIPSEAYKNIIFEIRAGTGGDEAGLFVADLYKMYSRFAQKQNWRLEVMDSSPTPLGGFKELIFSISGRDVYQHMKYESGVHRVQRVPSTETGGRIHTSAVSVVVLPEPEEVEVKIDTKDLKVDTYRASGAGGQHVNVTDSAVRITHLPSGIVVACQDERSQIKNRQKAMRILKARLLDFQIRTQERERDEKRRVSVGTGDRSEKIRTYNFPDNRVTDHRINLTLYKLEGILNGDIDEVVESLTIEERKEMFKKFKLKGNIDESG